MPQQSALEYIRTGQIPFFRLPLADPRALGEADAALIGVPFDAGTTYQPGARFAPWHLRRVSALVQSVHPEQGVDVFERIRAVDAGNVAFPPFDPGAMRETVEQEVQALAAAGAVPFVVGGDHSVALPVLRALFRKHGPLAVLHVDAHLDTSPPETWGAPHHHGTPFRHALSEGLIAPGRLVQVGLRATWGKLTDGGFARAHEARQVTVAEIEDRGMGAVALEVRERLGEGPVYVSFDVDAVDPAFAPGTGTPVPGGLTSRESFQLLRALRGKKLAGMDLVEVCPALDHADLTCHLGAHLLFEGLALLACAASPR
ncbi:MAG TPA: agmatinase [Myxococcales bacterium]|nr:agmatinase [Myxococcales bacterium]